MPTYPLSDFITRQAAAVTPGGSQTASKAPGRIGPLGEYPAYAERGEGAVLTDLDGRTYIDFVAALAAVGLGYNDPDVFEAVRYALGQGNLLSLPTRDEALASEALCLMTGWAEQARWVKTGSEATEAACRMARKATGRTRILTITSGYHAWHSWFQAVKPEHPGVPKAMADLMLGVRYGETQDYWWEADDVAAVILEPAPITGGGDPIWLKLLVEHAHAHGALVIFDEIVWGLRLARAGGTQYFGVTPDLATYGKALGNGIPVAAVVGRRDLMKHADVISSTFGGDRLGLAAATAVLTKYQDNRPIAQMWERGEQLVKGVREIGMNHTHVQVEISGYPVHPIITITSEHAETALLMNVWLQELADHGVLWHPAGSNIMACLTDDQIRIAVAKMDEAVSTLERRMRDGTLATSLRGQPYQQAFARKPVGVA